MSSSINPLHDNESENSSSGSLSKQNSGGSFYGWWWVGVGVFVLSLMSLSVFRGMSVMTVVLQREFGWTRTQISLSALLNRVEGAALGPIEGYLIDRIGARKMVFVGFSIMAIGFVLFSLVQNIWPHAAGWFSRAAGGGVCAVCAGSMRRVCASRWFGTRRF